MNQPTFPKLYEHWLARPLFRPWAELTLDEVNLALGDRLLDIACGTGIVARVARERLGDAGYIVGVDISPDMLAVARRVAPGIDWRQGNAADLPLNQGEQFNIVVCQQGLQFFPDKPAAVAQMRRALTSGAGSRCPPGARIMKSRSFESYAVSRNATSERSRIGSASQLWRRGLA